MIDTPGRHAASPWRMPLAAWWQVALRTWKETGNDNIGLIAAGVAFYGFLAIVPLLGAVVLSYGLIAEPATVIHDVRQLTGVMPAEAAKLIGDQLMNVVDTSDGKKGLGLLAALALAVFGARNAAGAIVTALNVAYDEEEDRGFIHTNLLSLAITVGGVLVAVLAMVAVAALGHLQSLLDGAPPVVIVAGKVLAYAVATLAGAAGAATLYRFGPAGGKVRWVWLTPGSLLAAALWLGLTLGFGVYVANFGHYNATYGSLGAVVVLLTWMYLSSYILLFGAELNSELERQEKGASDATETGQDKPAGQTQRAASPVPQAASVAVGARLVPRSSRPPLTASMAAIAGLALLRRRRGVAGGGLMAMAAAIAWSGGRTVRRRAPAQPAPATDNRSS